jgi:DNA-binding transcriptional ArsR family regulator
MIERSDSIDGIFHALADPTRRALIQHLSRGPAAVSELARPLPISLAAVSQHLQLLENCGLVRTHKSGRVRTCELDPRGLRAAERWIAQRRALWESRLDRLEALLGAQGDASRASAASLRNKSATPSKRTSRPRKPTQGDKP